MNAFNDTFEKMTEFGTQGLEPVRQYAGVAIDSMEKLARANYALYGEMMEFAVAQARLPLTATDPKELIERQMESGKAFVELVSERVNDYVELGKDLQDNMAQFVDVDTAKPAARATAKKTRKTKAA
jgi:ferritin-like protein